MFLRVLCAFAVEKINRKDAKDAKILLVFLDASLKSG
jgi:hypothetical protein